MRKFWRIIGAESDVSGTATMKKSVLSILVIFCLGFSAFSGKSQAVVALFGTNSSVPSLLPGTYSACDETLRQSILSRGDLLRDRVRADLALSRMGASTLLQLNFEQAGALLRELSCSALVQLNIRNCDITVKRLRSRPDENRGGRSRRGASPVHSLGHGPLFSPPEIMVAIIVGEFQIWREGAFSVELVPIQAVVMSTDLDAAGISYGTQRDFEREALRYALEKTISKTNR